MILAALFIGAITAYYFGTRGGAVAAVGAACLFVFGMVMPSKLIVAYGLVSFFTVGVLVVGPRLPGRHEKKADFFRLARKGSSQVLRIYRRMRK
jgi:hypothetical protein